MRWIFALVACAAWLAAGTAAPGAAEAGTLEGELSASLAGIAVATGGFEAVVREGRYQVRGFGRTAGLSRLFTSGEARVAASGRMSGSTVVPSEYRHALKDDDGWDRVRIAFADERVARVAIEPPLRPRRDRVPLGDEHTQRVLDPLGAVMQLSAGPPRPEMCERTLPVFDGEQRYDIALSFKREEQVSSWRGGYSGRAYVCAIRYRPIAGHRPGRSAIKFLQENDGMEIWLAPVAEGVVVPVRVRVPTPFGTVVVATTRLSLE